MLASQGVFPSLHFNQRGSLWTYMCSCSCWWPVPSSRWRSSGVWTSSLFGLLPQKVRPNALRTTVGSSPAPLTITPPVDSPLLLRWMGASACACASLVRGQKPQRSIQTHRHSGVCLSQPPVSLLRDHRRSSPRVFREMASMAMSSGSRPFAARLVARPSAPGAIPPCIV
jgi:hypothetical protein